MTTQTLTPYQARLRQSYRNLTLWTLQGWLSMFFLAAGWAKATEPLPTLVQLMSWPALVPAEMVQGLGLGHGRIEPGRFGGVRLAAGLLQVAVEIAAQRRARPRPWSARSEPRQRGERHAALRGVGQDLLALEPHERAAAGLFLGFQYPVEIPGVSNLQFLREALNAQRKVHGEEPLSGAAFIKLAKEQAALLRFDMDMLKRPVNVGFSGGEKKRAEMVQMGILAPKLAILDETDSGLDIDALRICGEGINAIMRKPDKAVLLITHYQRLLDYVKPDFVHVLAGGRIVKSGGAELALELEENGYEAVAA
jgi:Fe-S cluster assembly ATP-binding protein